MKYTKLYIALCLSSIFFSACLTTQKTAKKNEKYIVKSSSVDTIPKLSKPLQNNPKAYSDIITPKAVVDSGMFNIYKVDNKYLLEIADSLLSRDILIVSRIVKGATETRGIMIGYGGDQVNENVIRFEKSINGKLFVRSISYSEYGGDSTSTMYKSVLNSNIQPIVSSFEIKARSKDDKGVIIDITDYINGDNDILFFGGAARISIKITGYMADRSYIKSVKSFSKNIEIGTVKTYMKTPSYPGAPTGTATFELNTSMVLLPQVLMKSRSADSRVGYFSTGYTDFSSNPQGVEKVRLITRWRLEPKQKDISRYLAGELVEPAKQIVFYIDPSTPKKWVPFLIQGVNDWNVAFEKAGFKNAIVALEAPTSGEDWSLEDATHNAIVYKASTVANASGPHVHDPRTGEILETHVNWYHNVMSLLHNWYFIQAGAIDPRARKNIYDDELMGQLIRFVSSHEIGHTLGLLHNYGSSSTVPVENLRQKNWVEKFGHTPSIMDYARFNYVAQPEDHISSAGIFPRINDYDLWAIEWGYRWFPEENKEAEKEHLNKWIIARTSSNKRLWFGGESDEHDPRSQNEDLGDNAMKAGAYGIKNLKRILPNIILWTTSPGDGFEKTQELYGQLLAQFSRYMGHVAKNVGGIMTTPKSVEEKGPIVTFVSRSVQKEAIVFLSRELFTTPTWLLNNEIFKKTESGSLNTIIKQQDAVLTRVMHATTIYKLMRFEGNDPVHAYTAAEMLSDLDKGIFSELRSGVPISIFRRGLQKIYVEKLVELMAPPPTLPPGFPVQGPDVRYTDVYTVAKMEMRNLISMINHSIPIIKDKISKAHLIDLSDRLRRELNKNTR